MSENTAIAKAKETESAGSKKGRGSKASAPSFNLDELRNLALLVNEHGFTDFEFENENIRVHMSKLAAPQAAAPAAAPVSTASPTPAVQTETPSAPVDPDEGMFKITSPIVGTFYSSPGPDKEPYVKQGSKVTPESVVCIVEAMKLMNEIQAETTGEIVRIYVENGQPVEYGQPLFGIKK